MIHLKTKEKELELEKQLLENQVKVIDARQISDQIKRTNFIEKAQKLNNYFTNNQDIQHYSKYREAQEKQIDDLTQAF